MRRSESEIIDDKIIRLKWILAFIGLIVFIVALVGFGLCLWIRFDLDFWEFIIEINWYTYWNCMYVIMASMVLLIFTSLIKFYGIASESKVLMLLSIFLLIIVSILHLAGSIAICIYGVEESDILIRDLTEVFRTLINNMDTNHRNARILRKIQEYVGCCGGTGSSDYNRSIKEVPRECRNRVTGSEYKWGCSQKFAWYIEPWTASLAGICLTLIIAHVVQSVILSKIISLIRKYEKAPTSDTF